MEKIIVLIGIIGVIGFIVWWFFGKHATSAVSAAVSHDVQNATVVVNGGYSPDTVILKQGVPAKLTFNRKDPSSCLEQVVFPDLGITDFLPHNEAHTVAIDTSHAGEYAFACGMNMFHGKVIVK